MYKHISKETHRSHHQGMFTMQTMPSMEKNRLIGNNWLIGLGAKNGIEPVIRKTNN